MDKTLLVAVLVGAALSGAYASCANGCSGHGWCVSHDRCDCYARWGGTDCSQRMCPSGLAFADSTSSGHSYAECSGRGTCDHASGECQCIDGYSGAACERTTCPNDCSGHGTCESVDSMTSSAKYAGWDKAKVTACKCDAYYGGTDCSKRLCPVGDDPLTTEIECQGVSKGNQEAEVQEITVSADKNVAGEMTLTYTDAYGQTWTTNPIKVGGDNVFEVLVDDNAKYCRAEYTFPMSSGSRGQVIAAATIDGDGAGDTTVTLANHGLVATDKVIIAGTTNHNGEQTITSVTATTFLFTDLGADSGSMTVEMNYGASTCMSSTAAQMDSILSANRALKNVRVTQASDVSPSDDQAAKYTATINDFLLTGASAGEIGAIAIKEHDSASDSMATVTAQGDHSMDIQIALQGLPYNVVPSVTVSRVVPDIDGSLASSANTHGNQFQQKYRVTFSDSANSGDQAMLQCNAGGCDHDGCAPRYQGVVHSKHFTTAKPGMGINGVIRTIDGDATNTATDSLTGIRAKGQGTFHIRSWQNDGTDAKVAFTSGTATIHWSYGSGFTDTASWAYDADASTVQTALRTITGWEGVTVSCTGTAGSSDSDCTATYAAGFDDGGKVPWMTYSNYLITGGASIAMTLAAHASPGYGEEDWVKVTTGGASKIGYDDIRGHLYIGDCSASPCKLPSPTYEIVGVVDANNFYIKAANFNSASAGNPSYWTATPPMVMWPEFSNSISQAATDFEWYATNAGTALPKDVTFRAAYGGSTTVISLASADSSSTFTASINTMLSLPSGTCQATDTVSGPRKVTITCPGWEADRIMITVDAAGGEGLGRRSRNANPRRLSHVFAVGDTLSVEAGSTANLNRQFKIRSYETDNTYDNTEWAKVWPAPEDDYDITDVVGEGNNATTFSRRVETVSTYNQEIVEFHLHDTAVVGAPVLSGWFTFDYDGETSAVVQATASDSDIQEKLASLAGISTLPTVTYTDVSGVGAAGWEAVTAVDPAAVTIEANTLAGTISAATGVVLLISKSPDNLCANEGRYTVDTGTAPAAPLITVNEPLVTEGTPGNCLAADESVSTALAHKKISVTFQGQSGDAKKLSITNNNLVDQATNTAVVRQYYKNDGSVLYDSTLDGALPEELAMDMAPGGTINVTSQETIMVYLVDQQNTGCNAAACTKDALAVCGAGTTPASTCPMAVFEYNGQYTAPQELKEDAISTWCADGGVEDDMEAAISGLTGMAGLTVACSVTGVQAEFDNDFASAPGDGGKKTAIAMITIVLPFGADGSKFRVHQHTTHTTAAWLTVGNTAATQSNLVGDEGLWVKRRRNNNGRSFTLNKVYENRVASIQKMVDDGAAGGDNTITYTNTDSTLSASPMFSFDTILHSDDIDTTPFVQGMKTDRFTEHCGRSGRGTTAFRQDEGAVDTTVLCKNTDFPPKNPLTEFGERYAYIGQGPDKLYLDPQPDSMTDSAAVITYTGPKGSCTVTEVTRGSTEAKECSGRGNCDYESGTCICDEGYTLEACSEQTVLV